MSSEEASDEGENYETTTLVQIHPVHCEKCDNLSKCVLIIYYSFNHHLIIYSIAID